MLFPITVITFSTLFLFCFFAKMGTENFLKMGDCLYDSNWHELPVNLQKYLILIIGNMQIPIHYHGFGLAYLNLETFAKVCKTVITYYMMFKTLTTNWVVWWIATEIVNKNNKRVDLNTARSLHHQIETNHFFSRVIRKLYYLHGISKIDQMI